MNETKHQVDTQADMTAMWEAAQGLVIAIRSKTSSDNLSYWCNRVDHVVKRNQARQEDAFTPTPDQIRLQPWFQAVANPKDWKAPITAYIRKENLDITLEAIHFYTATNAVFIDLGDGWVRVRAEGYRRGPAGDH